jgi:SAM-dependent methyltransferase
VRRCLACEARFSSATWVCPECSWSPAENGVPLFAPALSESSEHFPREDAQRLAALETTHFWFTARNELIAWAISRYFPRAQSLLEIGCGTGVVLAGLRARLPYLALSGADLLADSLAVARERVPEAEFAQVDIRQLPYTEEFDVVCALDVLEHVDEDALALEQIARASRPGGGVVISVPQHGWLWSAADEYGRHRRRYSRRGLLRLLDEAGLEPVRTTSFMSLLLPVVAVSRLRHRRLQPSYDPFRELSLPARVNRALQAVMSAEARWIRRGGSFPVGSSLLVVAESR